MSKTRLLFINHSSVLIKYEDRYLLCDPWYQQPAFGSWLPAPPPFVHPVYLAALGSKLSILISHGHDDHLDDPLLPLFDQDTPIISSDYASPSVKRRVEKLGLKNYHEANEQGVQIGPFHIRSMRNDDISQDDASYTIETPDALVVHGNDNWCQMPRPHVDMVSKLVQKAGAAQTIFMSQTNSASGYPLTYPQYNTEDQDQMLRTKVHQMIEVGLANCHAVGAKYFHSYAGFALPFVFGKDYHERMVYPDTDYINAQFPLLDEQGLEVVDLRPGDTWLFPEVQKSIFANDTQQLPQRSQKFYQQYGQIEQCDGYQNQGHFENHEGVCRFLEQFNHFVVAKVNKDGFNKSIIGKRFKITLEDVGSSHCIEFGKGLVSEDQCNKELIAQSGVMEDVINGKILFENLYTGYGAQWKRYPADVYNRDIVQYLVMFSYPWRNRLYKQ
jgi:hypothetical protein